MNFTKLTLGDRALFEEYMKLKKPQISEMTFTNLFMWREFYGISYAVEEELLWILSFPERGQPFAFMPLGRLTPERLGPVVSALKAYFSARGERLVFKRVPEADLELLRPFASVNGIQHDRDSSDYIYLADDLINLTGKKYHGKRNHINKFLKSYQHEYIVMDTGHIDACKSIMEQWCSERSCEDHRDLYCEKLANFELLDNFSRLGCKGALVKVDGKFEAFTVGEMLNDDTAVIHIEKARSSIHGLYTFINQQFVLHEWKTAKYINREQDLGLEGLRKAKLSYNPAGFSEKYTVIIE